MKPSSGVRWVRTIFLLCCCAGLASARIGTVVTEHGAFHGHIMVAPERLVIASDERNFTLAVPWREVIELTMETPAPPTNPVVATQLTAPWRETDIGHQQRRGSTRVEGETFTVRGAGRNIDAEGDSFHFVYRPMVGDAEVVARISMIQYTHPNAKAGLMMRDNLGEYSRNVMLALTAQRGGAFQARYAEGRITQSVEQPELRPPGWLKLRRRGEEFFAYWSRNGRQWKLVEQTQLSVGEEIFVGLAVASARENVLNWSVFDRVRTGRRVTHHDYTPRVELASGSVITGALGDSNHDTLRFSGNGTFLRVPIDAIARIFFQQPTWETMRGSSSRAGVLLPDGDFLDGEFQGIRGDRLRMASVLYGPRQFEIPDEVASMVLQPRSAMQTAFVIETIDGSRMLATDVEAGQGEFKLKESALGPVRLPAFRVLAVRRQ